MPHVSSSGGGDDLGSEDEVKVFKDEGEDEKRSSENLTEEKSSLIDLTESEEKGSLAGGSYATTGKTSARSDLSPVFGKVDPTPHTSSFNMGYLVSPYPYPNGAGGPIPVSMVSIRETTFFFFPLCWSTRGNDIRQKVVCIYVVWKRNAINYERVSPRSRSAKLIIDR
ncbi:protein pangolin, isoforms A/H/I/S-like [Bombus pascuorum]|uniref:protein pangolin, isoforms A/H/I/S-like n=1 Tax=Bombus pascuorum TaxID=65598 RepID=UPI00298E6AE7|nr:protein pangolin, isoforms A/H/I/S-like [Bombus pascuorum]